MTEIVQSKPGFCFVRSWCETNTGVWDGANNQILKLLAVPGEGKGPEGQAPALACLSHCSLHSSSFPKWTVFLRRGVTVAVCPGPFRSRCLVLSKHRKPVSLVVVPGLPSLRLGNIGAIVVEPVLSALLSAKSFVSLFIFAGIWGSHL